MGGSESKCINCFTSSAAKTPEDMPVDISPSFEPMPTFIADSKFHQEEATTSVEEDNEDSNSFSKDQLVKLIDKCQEEFLEIVRAGPLASGFTQELDDLSLIHI